VREDINQSFSSNTDSGPVAAASVAPAQAYLDLLNSSDDVGIEADTDAPADLAPPPVKPAKPKAGLVDAAPAKKPAPAKPAKKNGLREI
jgi:hypothetical protein